MANINMKQLKATVIMLKNYIDSKASGGGSGSTTTTSEVTKEYVDNKMLYNGYETLYTIPADDITNAEIKEDTSYTLQSTGSMELNDDDTYIVIYGGVTYTDVTFSTESESGIGFEGGTLLVNDSEGNAKIGLINKFDLYTTNDNACRVVIHNIDISNITDLIIKKKMPTVSTKILALSKTEYDAIITKDENTIYIVTNE